MELVHRAMSLEVLAAVQSAAVRAAVRAAVKVTDPSASAVLVDNRVTARYQYTVRISAPLVSAIPVVAVVEATPARPFQLLVARADSPVVAVVVVVRHSTASMLVMVESELAVRYGSSLMVTLLAIIRSLNSYPRNAALRTRGT